MADCEVLFDPCTKAQLTNFAALERRVEELKRGLLGVTTELSIYDFLNRIFINPDVSIDRMISLDLQPDIRAAGTDMFDVLVRLFIFFGGVPEINVRDGGNYNFAEYGSIQLALQTMKCITTEMNLQRIGRVVKLSDPYCEVPCIDPVVINRYKISTQWIQDTVYTQTPNLTTLREGLDASTGVLVFIKDKTEFQAANEAIFHEYQEQISGTFFGFEQDVKPFLERIRGTFFAGGDPLASLMSQYLSPKSKPILQLQLHQEIIVTGLCNRIGSVEERDTKYLVGVLPRGGKTYIAGGIMREYLRRNPEKNLTIFWITAAPNETMSQVQTDLIEKFQDFNDFVFISARDDKYNLAPLRETKRHAVIFCSTQLLILSEQQPFVAGMIRGGNQVGMVFFDESHKTGSGEKTEELIKGLIATYAAGRTPFVFLTATYYKTMVTYTIKPENLFTWDYTDVLMTRKLRFEAERGSAIENLYRRFGEPLVAPLIFAHTNAGESFESIARPYQEFPNLTFVSKEGPGYVYTDLFDIKEEALSNLDELRETVKGTWNFIGALSAGRTRFSVANKPTLLMFMPTGKNIQIVLKGWARILMEDPEWGANYEVACLLDGESDEDQRIHSIQMDPESGKNIKQQLFELERTLQCREPSKGLIILAGSKLSTGISLPCTDVVYLLNDDNSADDIIQKMYRALTPSPLKTSTYVVDYTPVRTFAAIYGYTLLSQGVRQIIKKSAPGIPEVAKPILRLLESTYTWEGHGGNGGGENYVDSLYRQAVESPRYRCLMKKDCPVPGVANGGYRRTTLRKVYRRGRVTRRR